MPKYILIIVIIFLSLNCKAQDIIFEQEYYSKTESRVHIFRQEKDSLFLYSRRSNKERDSLPHSKFKVINDSIVNDTTKVIFLKYKMTKSAKVGENKLLLINYNNGRKGCKFIDKERKQKPEIRTLYPKIEFENLIPVAKLSDIKNKELMKEFLDFEKFTDLKQIDFDSLHFWTKLNSFFIKKGYNPFLD